MEYVIAAIPTKYNKRQYRSRLEAHWAAMFDLLGWKHDYEGIDLSGWFPDFTLYGAEDLLVEVKPFTKLGEFDEEIQKITRAIQGTRYSKTEILLLGSRIFQDSLSNAPVLGWIGEPWELEGKTELVFDQAHFNHWLEKWGFYAINNSYRDRITGLYNGNEYIDVPWLEEVEELWSEAANEVQWHP